MSDLIYIIIDGTQIAASKENLMTNSKYFEAMFQDHFLETNKKSVEIHSVKIDAFQVILEWTKEGKHLTRSSEISLAVHKTPLDNLLDVLECANMLQFLSIIEICTQELHSRVDYENVWTILSLTELLSISTISSFCENFILWNFKETLKDPGFTSVSSDILIKILSNKCLNVLSESTVIDAISCWYVDNSSVSLENIYFLMSSCIYPLGLSQEDLNKLQKHNLSYNINDSKVDKTAKRKLPFLPCVIARIRKQDKGIKNLYQILAWDSKKQDMILLNSIKEGIYRDDETRRLDGFKVSCWGNKVFITGGEFELGHGQWFTDIMTWDSLNKEWEKLTSISFGRRHHSSIIVGNYIYLLGGFIRHRDITDSVVAINLETGVEKNCDSLPFPMYKPAASNYGDDKIVVIGKQKVSVYDIRIDSWRLMKDINFPPNTEFDQAMYDDENKCLFLTSRISTNIFKLTIDDDVADFELIGNFDSEAKNTCLIEAEIFNFASDEFSYELSLEKFMIKEKKCEVLWRKDAPGWDVSAYNCIGCFPLVHYDFK